MSVTILGYEVAPDADLSGAFYGIPTPEGWSGDIGHATEFCVRCKNPMEWDGPDNPGEDGQWACENCNVALVFDDETTLWRYVDGETDEWLDALTPDEDEDRCFRCKWRRADPDHSTPGNPFCGKCDF